MSAAVIADRGTRWQTNDDRETGRGAPVRRAVVSDTNGEIVRARCLAGRRGPEEVAGAGVDARAEWEAGVQTIGKSLHREVHVVAHRGDAGGLAEADGLVRYG